MQTDSTVMPEFAAGALWALQVAAPFGKVILPVIAALLSAGPARTAKGRPKTRALLQTGLAKTVRVLLPQQVQMLQNYLPELERSVLAASPLATPLAVDPAVKLAPETALDKLDRAQTRAAPPGRSAGHSPAGQGEGTAAALRAARPFVRLRAAVDGSRLPPLAGH